MQWFFARRYLISRSSHSVINIIAGVSLVSVAIPVAAMIILLSVFNGFEGFIKDMYATTDADLELLNIGEPSAEIRDKLLATEGVDAVSFVIEGQALARANGRQTAVALRGVDSCYFDVLPLVQSTLQGKEQLISGDRDLAITTQDVAQMLAIYTIAGSEMSLHTLLGGDIGSILPLRGFKSCKVGMGGIIRQSHQLRNTAIIPYRTAAKLFNTDKTKAYIECSGNIEGVKAALQNVLGDKFEVRTREQKNAAFYQIMRYEKWAVFFVALLVLIIASLSIIGTVIMLIVEKRDQQQTLLSMGADSSFIRGIFVREGLLISGIGGGVGLIVGIAIVVIQQVFGIIKLPAAGFLVESYPVELQAGDIIAVFITFVAISWAVSQIAANTMIKRR